MNKFHGDQPWSRITTLAKRSARTRVAVPYLHGEANRMLPLKAADVLKVNIMSCQVNPDELRAYRRKGVKLYTAPNLHAKVFVFGNTAIIGSTNVSSSSETRLREAVVETTDPSVVASARKFIEESRVRARNGLMAPSMRPDLQTAIGIRGRRVLAENSRR